MDCSYQHRALGLKLIIAFFFLARLHVDLPKKKKGINSTWILKLHLIVYHKVRHQVSVRDIFLHVSIMYYLKSKYMYRYTCKLANVWGVPQLTVVF